MPRIQMENLEGHFLRRMMIGPKCNFIRVYYLSINEALPTHPLFYRLLLPAALLYYAENLLAYPANKLPWFNELFVMLC